MYFVVVAFLKMPTYVSGLNSVGLSDDSVPSLATKHTRIPSYGIWS